VTATSPARKVRWEEPVFAFLRAELAPSAARWRDSLRLTLLCAVATTLVMAFHIPYGEFLIIFFFAVSQRDAWASFRKARLRGIGTVLGGALAVLVIVACGDKPWLFFLTQALIFATGLFLMRTTTVPYAVLLAMFTFVIVVPPMATDPEASLEKVVWRIVLTVSGAVIGTVAQLVLWPEHPEGVLLRKLAARLRKAGSIIAGMSGDQAMATTGDTDSPSARAGLSSAMATQLDLLASVEAGSRWFRRRHAEQAKLISDVELVLVNALRLEELSRDVPSILRGGEVKDVLDGLRNDLERLALTLESGGAPALARDRDDEAIEGALRTGTVSPALLTTVLDLHRLVRQMPESMAFLATSDARSAGDPRRLSPIHEPIAERTIFTPACRLSNLEVVRFAFKGTLAASLCYVIYQALDWPGISTSVVTCLITAQSSFGAGLQKSLLRFIGAVVGGVLAVAAVLVCWPNMEGLGSFIIVTSALFFAASWISAGSTRISYVGMQMGLVMALVLVNSPSQGTSLAPAGDRIVGVLLGISVMGVIDRLLWPSFASEAWQRKLAEVFRGLAGVARQAGRRDWESARESAFGVHREIAAALGLCGESQFEMFPARTTSAPARRRLLAATNAVAAVFLSLERAVRSRRDLEPAVVPDGWWQRMQALDETVARRLEALADWSELPPGKSLSDREKSRGDLTNAVPEVGSAAIPSAFDPLGCCESVTRDLTEDLRLLESTLISLGREIPDGGGTIPGTARASVVR